MITASEPLEFIPRGRQTMNYHPGPPARETPRASLSAERVLLEGMQNVKLSASKQEPLEFYSLREVPIEDATSATYPLMPYVCTEEELYVCGYTAVWTTMLGNETSGQPHKSYTIDRPIRFAFFCPDHFLQPDTLPAGTRLDRRGICVVDDEVLHVYCDDGETYGAKIESPISAIWFTPYGLLLEKEPCQSQVLSSVPMPRLFTLPYPTDEMKPVLVSNAEEVDYLTDPESRVVFASDQLPLVLLYDKQRRHSVCWLRVASDDERAAVQVDLESACEDDGTFTELGACSMLASTARGYGTLIGPQASSFRNVPAHATSLPAFDRTVPDHIDQSAERPRPKQTAGRAFWESIGPIAYWESIYNEQIEPLDIRKMGFAEPWKPILPEYCLQYIWNDEASGGSGAGAARRSSGPSWRGPAHGEMASDAFLHIDLVGVWYICYLQSAANRLNLVRVDTVVHPPAVVASYTIPACSAVSLEWLNLIILLNPTGKLMLYSGPLAVGKVHVSGLLPTSFLSAASFSAASTLPTGEGGGPGGSAPPRPKAWSRSSLLPNATPCDSTFEDELHTLSPVRGSPAAGTERAELKLCDGTGTRFTIAFGGGIIETGGKGRSFRVALPPLAESQLVRRCLVVLRHVLPTATAHEFLIRWYGTRNVPGSHAGFSIRQEWHLFQALLFSAMGRPVVSTDAASEGGKERPAAFAVGSGPGLGRCGDEPKKRRRGENTHGTDCDWEMLLHAANVVPASSASTATALPSCHTRLYKASGAFSLYRHIPAILQTLHLLYEDLKLDDGLTDELRLLGEFLYCLASDAQATQYQQHYFLDLPELYDRYRAGLCRIADVRHYSEMYALSRRLPNIFRYLQAIVQGKPLLSGLQQADELDPFTPYPHLAGINDRSRDVVVVVALLYRERRLAAWVQDQLRATVPPQHFASQQAKALVLPVAAPDPSRSERFGNMVVSFLIARGLTFQRLYDLPVAVRFLLQQCLEPFREYTMHGHDTAVYELLQRPDLQQHAVSAGTSRKSLVKRRERSVVDRARRHEQLTQWLTDMAEFEALTGVGCTKEDPVRLEREDGMDNLDVELLQLLFPYDKRVGDVRAFLTSSARVLIDIPQGPNVSDHDFIEDQERRLYSLCLRTMALPVGRGMFTFSNSRPLATETAPVPRLCLTGREPLRGSTIEVLQLEVPPHMNLWPSFHNGVAAGLRIAPDTPQITSSWIINNRNASARRGPAGASCPFTGSETRNEHGGFLLALGLTGHLRHLSLYPIYDYMVRSNELTRLGLLLGLSVAHRGTEHLKTTTLLAVHVEALLPPTAMELDVTQNLQVAALFGVGLVYQGTAKRHIAEVLLQEIGRPPGPEMDNCVERESYALAAGLALGLVTLGRGDQLTGLRDLDIPGELYHYMNGGTRRMAVGAQHEKYKLPSFQIREGETVNLDVTAPGATLALGIMFFGTGDPTVTGWLTPPDTKYLFEFVRPDMLLLRIIARHLICWDDVQPTEAWVRAQLPAALLETIEIVHGVREEPPPAAPSLQPNMNRVERELHCQAYCAIVCGSSIGIGLRYAGTADPVAASTLNRYLHYFIGLRHPKPQDGGGAGAPVDDTAPGGRKLAKLVGNQVVENCVLMTLLALSLVLAGTGDLRVLRTVRMLRSRVGVPGVTYGSHMAAHMALGFAFLGGGRYTLSRSPPAIAALVCALFPKFPVYSNDNRYHLQALRHLYVLAIEPRLFVPRRIDTGRLTCCEIRYATRIPARAGRPAELRTETRMSPCLLPELHTLAWVEVSDENFYIVRFDEQNWTMLETILRVRGYIDVLQHVGCLSHLDDPTRVITMRMKNLPGKDNSTWSLPAEQLLELVSQPFIVNLTQVLLLPPQKYGLRNAIEPKRTLPYAKRAIHYFQKLVAHCVMYDRMHVISIMFDLTNMLLQQDARGRKPTDVWQLQLLTVTLGSRVALRAGTGHLMPGHLLRALALRAHKQWGGDLTRYRTVLQNFCGVSLEERASLFHRLCVLALSAHEEDEGESADADRFSRLLARVARAIVAHELPLDLLNQGDMLLLWPHAKPTRTEFVCAMALHRPNMSRTAAMSLAHILNLVEKEREG